MKLSMLENGISRFSGLSPRTILPSRSVVSSSGMLEKRLCGCTEVGSKLFVQAHLNTPIFLRNLVHLELVGRHLGKAIPQRFNPLQQLLATALHKISRRNACVEGVGENDHRNTESQLILRTALQHWRLLVVT